MSVRPPGADGESAPPLAGLRVLVTRAAQQASELGRRLAELGAVPILVPTIHVQPVVESPRIRAAIERLPETALVVFTSANAVRIFCDFLVAAGQGPDRLRSSKVCAIGAETERALARRGVEVALVADEYTAEGLVAALGDLNLHGGRVLVPRAAVGRDVLPELLAERGAEVDLLTVYQTVMPEDAPRRLAELFAGQGVDVVTFTSSSTVQNFAAAFPGRDLREVVGKASVACIGPVTAQTAAEVGLAADIVAREFTTRGLVAAIVAGLR